MCENMIWTKWEASKTLEVQCGWSIGYSGGITPPNAGEVSKAKLHVGCHRNFVPGQETPL